MDSCAISNHVSVRLQCQLPNVIHKYAFIKHRIMASKSKTIKDNIHKFIRHDIASSRSVVINSCQNVVYTG